MREEQLRSEGSELLFDAGAVAQPTAQHFDPQWWRSQNLVTGQASGRGHVCFVRHERQVWALRHYRRGGWMSALLADRYFWSGLEETRPWREFRLTARLQGLGLPVPQAVAVRVVRSGIFYRGDLITRQIPNAEPLADFLIREPLPLGEWVELGRVLRRFHDAGVRHEDINARNILRDAPGRFHLIDFDKARIEPAGSWRERNLARLRRSLEKFRSASPKFFFSDAGWEALRSGYSLSS